MPKMDWNNVEESKGNGGGFDIEPGAYTLVITKAEAHPDREYVRLYWDVAEGEQKGKYEDSQYPPSDIMSWKQTALGITKRKLHMLAEFNEGFKPSVAFDNDNWDAFVGKKFGAVVRNRLYTAGPNSKNPGADRKAVEVAAYIDPDELRDGTWSKKLMEPRDQRDPQAKAAAEQREMLDAAAATDIADEDIPF